jgi:hypothetical protein
MLLLRIEPFYIELLNLLFAIECLLWVADVPGRDSAAEAPATGSQRRLKLIHIEVVKKDWRRAL